MGNCRVCTGQAEWLRAIKITAVRPSKWQAHGETGIFHVWVKHALFPDVSGKMDWPLPGLSKNLSKQEGTESKWSSSQSCFLTEGSSWQKKVHEDTRHQASTFNSHELTTWSSKPWGKETLRKLSSSHNYSEDHTQHKGESRWVPQESEVLDTHSCWGIWSLAWPDQPKDSIHLYPSTLLNLGLLWNGAQFPAITSDCFTVPKGVRTSSAAKLCLEWFPVRAMQVKGGAPIPRPSPRGAAWLPEIRCACVCISRVLQRIWIMAAFNKCLVKLWQSLLVLTIKYPVQCSRCKIQHAKGEVYIKMSYHMPLPCSALADWCWLNLRGANSA